MAAHDGRAGCDRGGICIGGTCVIRGCIPKKLFVYASHFSEDFEDAAGFGWTVPTTKFDWNVSIANKNKEIARLEGLYRRMSRPPASKSSWTRAVFDDAHTLRLVEADTRRDGRQNPDRHRRPSLARAPAMLPGSEHCITSNEAFHLEELPEAHPDRRRRLYRARIRPYLPRPGRRGVAVYRGPKILRGFDEDMRDALRPKSTPKRGIRVLLDANSPSRYAGRNASTPTGTR